MADALKKVSPGDRLGISANAYNAFVDAARYVRNQQADMGGEVKSAPALGSIWVKNVSGSDRARFDILSLGQPVFGPTDNLDEFKSGPVMTGIMPAATQRGQFAVLQEPVANGKIARAVISGQTLARVEIIDGDFPYRTADVADGVASNLRASASGAAAILWRAAGTGVQWALLRIGNLIDPAPFPVTLTQTGGSQGSSSSAASWTYRVTSLAGQVLANAVNPVSSPHQWKRPSVGFIIAGTFGYAHFDSTGQLALGWINEVSDQEACS